MASITVPHKKKGRPATGHTPRIGLRLPDDVRTGIDTFIADQAPPALNQSEAIRLIIRDWLFNHGYLSKSGD